MNEGALFVLLAAFLIAACLPVVLRPTLQKLSILDVPNDRSSHSTATLRGGGIAPLLGFVVGAIPLLLPESPEPLLAWFIVVPAALAGVIGLIEDVRGLPIALRAGGQLLLGVVVGVGLSSLTGARLWPAVFVAVAFAAYVNIANFMDGVNGISGLHGALAGAAYAVLGAVFGMSWLVYLGLLIAAVFVAFLPWNLSRPGLFLGDVGSYFLGGSLASLSLAALYLGVSPIGAVAPLIVYIADAVSAVVRRTYRGEPILRPHRSHVYQRLTDVGMSHLGAALVVTIFTAIAATAGLLAASAVISEGLAWIIIVIAVSAYLALPRILGSEVPPTSRYVVGETPTPAAGYAPKAEDAPTWVVLGASGFVGSALCGSLQARGMTVRAVAAPRLDGDIGQTDPVEIAASAADDPRLARFADAVAGADIIVNAAGVAAPDRLADPELYGANGKLPALVAHAAVEAKIRRVVHVSSAAVQGRRKVLDESLTVSPFSAYSHSKALGERAFLAALAVPGTETAGLVVRATSVQGDGRPTTSSLRSVARSPFASVAAPGSQPSAVSSIDGLVEFVIDAGMGAYRSDTGILLQPWEGLSVKDVLRIAGQKQPVVLPRWLCAALVSAGFVVGRVVPEISGLVRRIEVMWFGQGEVATAQAPPSARRRLVEILEGERSWLNHG